MGLRIWAGIRALSSSRQINVPLTCYEQTRS